MRKAIVCVVVTVAVVLAGCGAPEPAVLDYAQLLTAFAANAGYAPEDIPVAALHDLAAIAAGESVAGVASTPQNQVISPVTGKPCPFVTTQGLTPLGVVVATALVRGAQMATR